MAASRWWILVGGLVAVTGCTVGRGPLVVGSDDPAVNVPAMVKAGETNDLSKLAALVDELGSTDPAIRMFAIQSLEDLTDGETFGYRYFDPEPVRISAIERWRAFVASKAPTTSPSRKPAKGVATTLPVAVGGGHE
jgi:hypothetical protein